MMRRVMFSLVQSIKTFNEYHVTMLNESARQFSSKRSQLVLSMSLRMAEVQNKIACSYSSLTCDAWAVGMAI